jgi:NAD(P)-dependent dehydrogenase (short-subunit alcohol dehydrogenase family)
MRLRSHEVLSHWIMRSRPRFTRLKMARSAMRGRARPAGMRRVAEQVNALGTHDAVIHNAGVGYREPHRVDTIDGLEHIFAINVH